MILSQGAIHEGKKNKKTIGAGYLLNKLEFWSVLLYSAIIVEFFTSSHILAEFFNQSRSLRVLLNEGWFMEKTWIKDINYSLGYHSNYPGYIRTTIARNESIAQEKDLVPQFP